MGPVVNGQTSVSSGVTSGIFGTLGAGTYIIEVGSTGNTGNLNYRIDINPIVSSVPVPASALLLLTGLAGLGVFRARKRA